MRRLLASCLVLALLAAPVSTVSAARPRIVREADFRHFVDYVWFATGAVAGLAAHEFGHILANLVFGTRIDFVETKLGPFPFFAIQPCCDLNRREEYAISSAGFVAQEIGSEIILRIVPRIREERHAFLKGMLWFHIALSTGYAITAFANIGPPQSDVNSMARALNIDPWKVGLWLMIPAMIDMYRYFVPDSKWAPWVSASSKFTMIGATWTF